VFTKIGNHVVKHGDICDGIEDLMGVDQADFIYTDPPWGQGTLSYWQTKNVKDNGGPDVVEKRPHKHLEFLATFFNILVKHGKGPVIVEYGEAWKEEVLSAATQAGLSYNETYRSFYKSGAYLRPLHIHFFNIHTEQDWQVVRETCQHQRGQALVSALFEMFCPQNGIVLDPMCGMGFSAVAAVKRGCSFRGNELNKTRLAKTITKLKALNG
tara:strand:- start:240 stop:875 length:636 start_codon:yes stop_codon:yes gene_type:complete